MRSRAATVLLDSGGPAVLECEDASSLGAPRAASALMAIMDASAPRLVARIAAPPEFLLGPDPDPARVDSRIQHRVKLASEVGSDCQKRTLRQRRPGTAAALSRSDKWTAGGTAGPVRRSASYRGSPLMAAVIAPPPHHLGRPDPEAFRRGARCGGDRTPERSQASARREIPTRPIADPARPAASPTSSLQDARRWPPETWPAYSARSTARKDQGRKPVGTPRPSSRACQADGSPRSTSATALRDGIERDLARGHTLRPHERRTESRDEKTGSCRSRG